MMQGRLRAAFAFWRSGNAWRLSERLGRRQNLLGVAWDFHLAPDLGEAAIAVDQKGRALDAEILAAVHAFFLPHAVGLDRRPLRVGRERELEFVLKLELLVARGAVRRDADDHGSGGGEFGPQGVESDSFGGAAGRIVLGV